MSRPTLGGLGSSSSLMTRHDGDASAMVARTSTVIVTPLLAGWSWTTTGIAMASATAR